MARYRPAVAMLLLILGALLLAAQPSSANRRAWRNGGGFQPRLEASATGGSSGGSSGSGSVYIVRLSSAPPLVEYRGGIAGYPATATWDDGRDANDGADDDECVPEMDLAATDVAAGADAASLRAAKHEPEDATTPAPPRSAAAADDDAAPSWAVKQTVPLPYWDDNDWSFFYSEPNATAPAPAGAAGSGGGNGNGGRAARRRMRLSMDRPQVAAFATLLQRQQAQVASEAGVLDADLIYSYKHTSNGFAARLTARQVWRLQRHPDVASVTPSRMLRLHTTDSPKFLGLPGKVWPAVGGQSKAGDGIVVGIVDSGIWPEHPSFSDAGMSSKLPSGWKGKCEQSSSFRCNNKVIGARAFYAAFGSPSLQNDWLSPRDSSGHGTWCAGAAAGNPVSMQGGGQMSGMVPAARLAVYKVSWTDRNGRGGLSNGADVTAAINQAVADGVDVLSLSLGGLGANQDYFGDLVYLRANAAGVFVAMSAGNSGATGRSQGGIYRTVANFSPFILSVGASTIARGASLAAARTTNIASATGSTNSSNSTGDSSATLTADGGITFTAASSDPRVADISSRGPLLPPNATARPLLPANDILKPDIIGPGVDLVAAAPSKKIGEPGTTARRTGTSMSTPHLAGLAAIIIQKYPDWSPAQVMSALMTTARVTDMSNSPIKTEFSGVEATPWEMGAGHVFPPAMLDPGLTYDVREKDYQNFLAGQDLNRAKKEFPGASLSPLAVRNLNLPTITLARLQGSVQVTRTVTCVGSSVSTYTVSGSPPQGVRVFVGPGSFTLAPGQKANYTLIATVETPSNDFKYGFIVWKDNKGHSVRSPLVVQPISR